MNKPKIFLFIIACVVVVLIWVATLYFLGEMIVEFLK